MGTDFERLKVCGIDAASLGERYADVRGTFLRCDADVLVISTLHLEADDIAFIKLAHESGHVVVAVGSKHHAPPSTEWITQVIF